MSPEEIRLDAMLSRVAVHSRRLMMILLFGWSIASWEIYLRERYGDKVKSCYVIAVEMTTMVDPPRIWFGKFWDGKKWVEKELRAKTYRSYLGAWWRAFLMRTDESVMIVRKPYSPRDWRPS